MAGLLTESAHVTLGDVAGAWVRVDVLRVREVNPIPAGRLRLHTTVAQPCQEVLSGFCFITHMTLIVCHME